MIEKEVKATWFITHDSPEIRRLSAYPDLFEVGLHPNFDEGSTQGNSPRTVMVHLKQIVPQACSVRTHGLVQSTSLLKMMREEFGILNDVTLFLPDTPNLVPHRLYLAKNLSLLRFPYFWADDMEMYKPTPCFSLSDKKYHVDGLKIFSLHPIHVVLNSFDMDNYFRLKSKKDLPKCSFSDIETFINSGYGTGTFFKELVEFISSRKECSLNATIKELASKWSDVCN